MYYVYIYIYIFLYIDMYLCVLRVEYIYNIYNIYILEHIYQQNDFSVSMWNPHPMPQR